MVPRLDLESLPAYVSSDEEEAQPQQQNAGPHDQAKSVTYSDDAKEQSLLEINQRQRDHDRSLLQESRQHAEEEISESFD
jgi:hypothetical protein